MSRILPFLFVTQVAAQMSIFDQNIMGFCHHQDVKIGVYINCDPSVSASIDVIIVQNRSSNGQNYNLQCHAWTSNNEWICFDDGYMRWASDTFHNTLNITFMFNHTIHAGHYLRIIGYCNRSKEVEEILLKPCASGFTSSAAFYNTTTVTVRCDHLYFNYSNTPMRIIEQGGNDHGSCLRNNSCTPGCKRLSDGIYCLVPYTSGKIYQCILDGAVYNITYIDTVPTPLPDTTTTTQRTTTDRPTGTSHRTTTTRTTTVKTTIPSQAISSLQSTGVNYMASIYVVVVGLLVILFI